MAKYRYKLNGICLFHSTPFADSEEKRMNRDREINLVREGKKDILFNTNIPKGFATDNLEKFSTEISRAKTIAGRNEEDGIIALLEGMKIRPDRQNVLKETGLPVLFILGKKDNYIPYDIISERIGIPNHMTKLILENSGHIGFIEEKEKCVIGFLRFLDNL